MLIAYSKQTHRVFCTLLKACQPLLVKSLHTSRSNRMPSALVFLAEGAEEMETVISVDVLRRGGVDVVLAGIDGDGPVLCSRNVTVVPDKGLKQALAGGNYDILVCPGGAKGAENLCKSADVGKALKDQENRGGYVAAICAGPTAFLAHGIATGKKVTSHPSVTDKLKGDYTHTGERVVVDGKVITSQGPGTTFEFALAIVEQLQGKEKAQSLIPPMLLKL